MVDIPDIVARGQQFRLIRDDRTLESFTGTEQYIANRPAYWSFTIPILPRNNVEAKRWRAAIVELSRPANTFFATPPGYRGSAYAQNRIEPPTLLELSNGTNLELSTGELLLVNPGFIGGDVFVDGAGQLGKELNVNGADPNEVLFRAGEYFSVNDELKVVTEDCTTDGQGKALVKFEPPLRSMPAEGMSLSIVKPRTSFRITSPAAWSLQPNRLHSFDIEAIESY